MPSLHGSGDLDMAREHEQRARRLARVLRDDVERLGDALTARQRDDALAAALRFDHDAAAWCVAIREYER